MFRHYKPDLWVKKAMSAIKVWEFPHGQLDKIFERFYRAADLRQQAIPGLSMGLYIVAEIIKHRGGTIMVDSAIGKGSTFTVSLPTACNDGREVNS